MHSGFIISERMPTRSRPAYSFLYTRARAYPREGFKSLAHACGADENKRSRGRYCSCHRLVIYIDMPEFQVVIGLACLFFVILICVHVANGNLEKKRKSYRQDLT